MQPAFPANQGVSQEGQENEEAKHVTAKDPEPLHRDNPVPREGAFEELQVNREARDSVNAVVRIPPHEEQTAARSQRLRARRSAPTTTRIGRWKEDEQLTFIKGSSPITSSTAEVWEEVEQGEGEVKQQDYNAGKGARAEVFHKGGRDQAGQYGHDRLPEVAAGGGIPEAEDSSQAGRQQLLEQQLKGGADNGVRSGGESRE